jgi:serine/threonine protein kinase
VNLALPLSKTSVIEGERGSYRLLQKIFEGGMGIVWEAESTEDKRHLIVKQPHVGEGDRRITFERLVYEAKILRYINDAMNDQASNNSQHLIRQHVVRYVDHTEDQPEPFLVLEFVNGPTMIDAFREKPAPETIALQYAAMLLKVVGALHYHGIIHRDISPSNIILNPRRGIVLIDFGTCQTLKPITGTHPPRYGRVILKRGFSAPELLQGHSDERSDIFSVGATLFFLLTGKNPGDFMSDTQVMTTTLQAVDKKISQTVSSIVETALSPDPNHRFRTATAMAAAIETTTPKGPRVVVGQFSFELKPGYTDIGRDHVCDDDCKSLGFTRTPQIRIADPKKYIEKHHARIWLQDDGRCMIEDLKSVNRTAIKSKTGQTRILYPSEKIELQDNDIVALAYNPTRGPYSTIEFKRDK